MLATFEHRAAVERVTLGVVGVIAAVNAIESVSFEEWRVLDEIELHSGANAAIKDGAEPVLVVEGDGYAGEDGYLRFQLRLPVTRQINADLMPQFNQRLRQCANNVCKTAGL